MATAWRRAHFFRQCCRVLDAEGSPPAPRGGLDGGGPIHSPETPWRARHNWAASAHHSRPSYWRTRRRRLESTRRFPRPMEPAEARRRHIGACVVALRLGTCIKESPRRRRRSVARSSCHHFLAVSPRLGTSHGYTLRAAFTIGCAAVPLSVCLPVGVSASYHTAPQSQQHRQSGCTVATRPLLNAISHTGHLVDALTP